MNVPGCISDHDDKMKLAARQMLTESSEQLRHDTFDRAWEKVYGRRNYKPSWIHRPKSPSKTFTIKSIERFDEIDRPNETEEEISEDVEFDEIDTETDKEISEDFELAREYHTKLVEGIPENYRTKLTFEPLKVSGKVVPNEKLLKKWRDAIILNGTDSEGRPLYNKIVKETDIPKWMSKNKYGISGKQMAKSNQTRKTKDHYCYIKSNYTIENYDMVKKYENRVKREDLKIGNTPLPDESTLNKLGEAFDIPAKIETTDDGLLKTFDDRSESEGRKKFRAVIEHANVPKFIDENVV